MIRRAGSNLIELTVVVFLFAVLMASTVSLTVNGLRALNLSEERVQMNQLIPVWQIAWQAALRGTDPAGWRMEGTTLVAEPVRIHLEDRLLRIQTAERSRHIPLPAIVSPSLVIERHASRADCAVLALHWESTFLGGITTNQVRFVACGRPSK